MSVIDAPNPINPEQFSPEMYDAWYARRKAIQKVERFRLYFVAYEEGEPQIVLPQHPAMPPEAETLESFLPAFDIIIRGLPQSESESELARIRGKIAMRIAELQPQQPN